MFFILRYVTLITPADWCFKIWSIIGIGEIVSLYCCVMYANHESDLFKKIFCITNLLSSLWLMLFNRQYIMLSSLTLPLISISLKFALDAIQYGAIISSWSTRMQLLCIVPIKIHFAFSLIASSLNLNVLLVSTMIHHNIHNKQIEYYMAQMTLWALGLFSLFQIIYFDDNFYSIISIWGLAAISDKTKHKKYKSNTEKVINQSIELTCLLLISCLSLTGLFKQFGPKLKNGSLVSESGNNVVSYGETILPLSMLLLFVLTFHIVIGHSILKRPFETFSK